MIEFRNVGYSYDGPNVLHEVNALIEQGEVVGVIGPSGSGKTTLLRILLGELKPTVGRIAVAPQSQLAIGYVPQIDAGERSFPITVEETVLLGGSASSARRPWFDRDERRQALSILERLGMRNFKDARLDEISGGQFQRVLIGRALMSQPNLLILDEPTSGIDLKTRTEVLDLVRELQRDGFTIVMTTHDLNWVAAHLPRIICLNRTVIADGNPIQVLSTDVVRATYGADMDVLVHNGRPVVVDVADGGLQ
jgi:ABC-type Mn2+/Zn2+ transport system ATPase subunit